MSRHPTRSSLTEDWIDRFYAVVLKSNPKAKIDEAAARRLCSGGYSPAAAAERYLATTESKT